MGLPIIFYLKQKSLDVIDTASESLLLQIDIPPQSEKNLEVLSAELIQKSVVDALTIRGVKKSEVYIVLSEEIVFSKSFNLGSKDLLIEQAEKFFAEIPLDPQKLAKKVSIFDSRFYALGTNSDLFGVIIEACKRLNWKVSCVVPDIFLKSQLALTVDIPTLTKAVKDKKYLAETDFLTKYDPNEVFEEKKKSIIDLVMENKKRLGLAVFGILILSVAAAFVLKKTFFSKVTYQDSSKDTKESSVSGEASDSADVQESTQSANFKKSDDLTVEVLNASGKVGQAKVVSDKLIVLGYKNVTTGNAESTPTTETQVYFSDEVSAGDKEKIVEMLKAMFISVIENNSKEGQTKDVVILTSAQK